MNDRQYIKYTPKGKLYRIRQTCRGLRFDLFPMRRLKDGKIARRKIILILEYDKSCRRYIPKNILGEKIVTALYGYTQQQVDLLELIGIVQPI
jgi:hypothetical protein